MRSWDIRLSKAFASTYCHSWQPDRFHGRRLSVNFSALPGHWNPQGMPNIFQIAAVWLPPALLCGSKISSLFSNKKIFNWLFATALHWKHAKIFRAGKFFPLLTLANIAFWHLSLSICNLILQLCKLSICCKTYHDIDKKTPGLLKPG